MRIIAPFPVRRAPLGVLQSLALALLLWSHAFFAAGAPPDADAVERYLEHVRTLAAPEMRGRGAGMPELDRAARYIADQFRELGLTPAGDAGTYLQALEVTTDASLGESNIFRVTRNRGTQALKLRDDFVPINFSASGAVEGEVVFAGYGATAPEFQYDDYFHLDVRDKLVLLLRYEPEFFAEREGDDGSEEGKSRSRRRETRHSHLIAKAIQARNKGAKAVLLVDTRTRGRNRDRLIRFGSVSGPTDAGIPMVQVRRDIIERWLRGSGRSLRLLQRDIEASEEPQSFALASTLRVSLQVDVVQKKATVSNVAGYLPGTTAEYLVLGAHYDHLGMGGENSLSSSRRQQVHPGADDNASGVAAILELAKLHAERPESPRRGLLFLAFAAEEIGLLGSSYWTEHPTLPLDDAVAMLNFDMVGRIKARKLYVGGVGTAEPFGKMVERAAASQSLRIDTSRDAYSSSDHTSFAAKKIPVLFFFSGLHSDYHKPSDTADKVDGESAMDLVAAASEIIDELVSLPERMAFVDTVPEPRRGGRGSGGGGYGPWFGSVPDFGEVPNGVRFADVRSGSPAAKAGLRGADILTHWNGDPILNLHDFTYALRDSEVGDTVTVRVLRDGKEIEAEVTLAERP